MYGEGSWQKQKKNGNEYHRYSVMIKGKQKDFYGKTKTEALKKYKSYIEKNTDAPKKTNLTIKDVAVLCVESKKEQIKSTTYDFYNACIERLGSIGNYQIQAADSDILQGYINSLKDTSAYSTIKHQRLILNMTFSYALEHGFVNKNPMKNVKLPNKANVVKEEKTPVFLTKEERYALERESERVYAEKEYRSKPAGEPVYGASAKAVVFILHTGLRIGELIALTWDDVDLDKKVIYIRRNAEVVKDYDKNAQKKYKLKISTPKRESSVRKVPLDKKAMNILNSLDRGETVFHTKNGTPLDKNHVARTLKTMTKRSGIQSNPSPHDLRHTYASELIAA